MLVRTNACSYMALHWATIEIKLHVNLNLVIMNIDHDKKAKKKLQDFESQDYKTWRSYELEGHP